jgi:hypothetical protein
MSLEIRDLRLEDAEGLLAYFHELVRTDPERVERPDDVDKITLEGQRANMVVSEEAGVAGTVQCTRDTTPTSPRPRTTCW